MNILLIDNYDSFTYNLLHLFESLNDVSVTVVRNDDDFMSTIDQYDGIIIGPGPGSPDDKEYFGSCSELLKTYQKPILGVCLGFQGIAISAGAELKKAPLPMHGKTSRISITNSKILDGITDGEEVMRYHSLMVLPESLNDALRVTAETTDGPRENGREIMAIEHVSKPHFGVQFHPESFASNSGVQIAQNFINIIRGAL